MKWTLFSRLLLMIGESIGESQTSPGSSRRGLSHGQGPMMFD